MVKRTVSIGTVLNLLAACCGLLCFLITQDGIGWRPAMLFLLAFLGALLTEFGDFPRPPSLLSLGMATALLVPILYQASRQYVAEPFLEAILLLFVLRLFEHKTSRDYVQIALLSLGAVLVYALLSVEKLFLVVCLGTGYCASLILMLAAWLRREPRARLSLAEVRSVLLRALGMFVLMVPLCLAIFFLAPRSSHPVFHPQGGAERSATTGFSERLQLGEVGKIQESDRLAFRVEVEEVAPESLYWRGVVLSYFTGTGWEVDLQESGGGWGEPHEEAPRVRQTVFLEPGRHRWLFALDRPLSVQGVTALSLGNGTFWRRRAGNGARYEAESVLSPLPGVLSPLAEAVFLELPLGYSPALRRLTKTLTTGVPDDRGRIRAVEAHFKNGDYLWSLGNLVWGEDALERFVLDVKRGNCEYFASAAGVMLRMANVPTRVVGGYRGGRYNRSGGYYSVQERQAHVWVEAWDRSLGGWVRIDPTPERALGGGGASENLGFWGDFWDFLDYQWNKSFLGYSARTQSEWGASLREALRNPRVSLGTFPGSLSRWGRAGMGLAVLLALVLGLRGLWKRRHRDRGRVLLERFDRLMKRRGFPRRSSEGLEEFVSCLDEPLQRMVRPFVLDFEKVWYGGRPLDKEAYRHLKRRLNALEKWR